MDVSDFFSKVSIEKSEALLEPGARILTLGSCFATEISGRLGGGGFDVIPSPGGVLYNPFSIAHTLGRALEGRPYETDDVVLSGGRWVSYHHGGSFHGDSPEAALEAMNGALAKAHEAMATLDMVILTFGTAYVYDHNTRGYPVASCHKTPARVFTRRSMSVASGVASLEEPLRALQAINPNCPIILTLSPVRHLRDDARENSHSKALCRVIAHELTQSLEGVTYFPSYEIVLDELRDYRFFGPDRAHPTEEAIAYVMERFAQAHLSQTSRGLLKELAVIQRGLAHRSSDPGGVADRRFCEGLMAKLDLIQDVYPKAKLGRLEAAIRQRLGR